MANYQHTSQEDDMPKTTVAQLEARVNELEALVNQLVTIDNYQGHALNDTMKSVRFAHDRLDEAKKVVQKLTGTKAAPQHRTTRKATAKLDGTRQVKCTVPGAHDTETTHTTAGLNACWQSYYAAKANA